MAAELIVAVVVIAFDGCLLDRPVHPLDLAICPEVLGLGQPVLDTVPPTCSVERTVQGPRGWSVAVLRDVGELDSVVGQHYVDFVEHNSDQRFQDVRGCSGGGVLSQVNKGERGRPSGLNLLVER